MIKIDYKKTYLKGLDLRHRANDLTSSVVREGHHSTARWSLSFRSVLLICRPHVPRLDTDHRQARFGESVEQPLRQRPSFQSNPLEVAGWVRQNRCGGSSVYAAY